MNARCFTFFGATLVWCALFAVHAAGQSPSISTIAGATEPDAPPRRGFAGDGGPPRKALLALANPQNECDPARFEHISHLTFDPAGNLYVADSANHRIRRITPQGITTFAGNGAAPPADPRTCVPTGGGAAIGEGGPAGSARLYHPAGVAFHPNGNLIIADQENNRVRQVRPDGVITTIAGNGLHAFYAPGIPATSSGLDWPTAVAISPDAAVYFSESHSGRVARIGADGRLTTVAGLGIPGFNGDTGSATSIRLSSPTGIAFDGAGNLYIADQGNHRIRKVTPDGALTTIAGSGAGFSGDGGAAISAQLDRPADVKVAAGGEIYISDMNNHRVRRIDTAGVITTVAGDGVPTRGLDGVPANSSSLSFPTGLAIDAAGDVLVVDWTNYLVRKIIFSGKAAITSRGVLNSASFAQGPVAPGSLLSIFGMNLASTNLSGTTVQVNGDAAPLNFVSPGQINAQVPYTIAEGDAAVIVTTPLGASTPEYVQVTASAPGVFVYASTQRAIALNQDNSINSPDNPESPGRVITIFLTGIGSVDPPIATGAAAGLEQLHRAVAAASATISGVDAPLQFLGLTPGFVGLAQANVLIPEATPAGAETALGIRVGTGLSNEVVVSVR